MENESKNMDRKEALIIMGKLAIGAGLLNAFGSCFPPEKQTLKSAYLPILDCVPLIVAYEQGFFKDEGVAAEKPIMMRAWPDLYDAFTSKQVQLTHILLPQLMFQRYKKGIKAKSIAFNHTEVISMLVAAEYNSLRDLGGKKVACPTWWAPHTCIFQEVFRKAGLVPVVKKDQGDLAPNEVLFVVLPPKDMPDALNSGAIAGCTVSEPFGAVAEIQANAKVVKFSGDVWPSHPCCQSVMLESTIEDDRDRAYAVTKAIYRASLWAHENPDELATILGKDGKGYFPMPIKAVLRALKKTDLETYGLNGTGAIMHDHWNVRRVAFNPYPFSSAFDVMLDLMRKTVVDPSVSFGDTLTSLTGSQVAKDIVDYDLAQRAYSEIGGKAAFGVQDSLGAYERKELYDIMIKP